MSALPKPITIGGSASGSIGGNVSIQVPTTTVPNLPSPQYPTYYDPERTYNLLKRKIEELRIREQLQNAQGAVDGIGRKIPVMVKGTPRNINVTVNTPTIPNKLPEFNAWLKHNTGITINGGKITLPPLWDKTLREATATGGTKTDKVVGQLRDSADSLGNSINNATKVTTSAINKGVDKLTEAVGSLERVSRALPKIQSKEVEEAAKRTYKAVAEDTRKQVEVLGDHFLNRLSDKGSHGLKVGAGTVASGAAMNILSHILFGEEAPHTALTVLAAIAGGIGTNKLLKKYPNVV